MKKIILLFMLLLLSGCKDYTEINDLGIISGMIIDYKDNKYEITTEIITNDKESELQILSTTSTSIDEAIKELSKLTNKNSKGLGVMGRIINELLCLLYRFKNKR